MKSVRLDDNVYRILEYIANQLDMKVSDALELAIKTLDRIGSDTCFFVDSTLKDLYIRDRDMEALSTAVNLGSYFYKEVLEEVIKDLGFEYPPLIEDISYTASPYRLFIYASVNKYLDSRVFDLDFISFVYEEDYEISSLELMYHFEEDIGRKFLKVLEEDLEDFKEEVFERVGYCEVDYLYEEFEKQLGGGYSFVLSMSDFEERPNLFTLNEIVREFIRRG